MPIKHTPPTIEGARRLRDAIGPLREHGVHHDAERAENALIRYAIDAYRDGVRGVGTLARIAYHESP